MLGIFIISSIFRRTSDDLRAIAKQTLLLGPRVKYVGKGKDKEITPMSLEVKRY